MGEERLEVRETNCAQRPGGVNGIAAARLESEHRGDEEGEERTRPRRRVRPEGRQRVCIEDVGRARAGAAVVAERAR